MANPKTDYFLDLINHSANRPTLFKLKERVYPDIHWLNQNRASDRIFHAVDGIEGLVVHATAGGSTSGALSWWKQPGGGRASAHWIVPDEDEAGHGKEVLAVVYEALAAWHVRNAATHEKVGKKGRINHWTLGVEVVNRQTPNDTFSNWQLEATAQIVRYCWAKYPNFRYVFSHALVDPERRSDPGVNFDWDKFVGLVLTDENDPRRDNIGTKIFSAAESMTLSSGEEAKKYCCE